MALLALLAMAIGPADAAARPGFEVQGPNLVTRFSVPATHGFTVTVTTHGHRRVELTASKGLFSATYATRGRVSGRRIVADFGRLGRVAVGFRGRGKRFASSIFPGLGLTLPGLSVRRDCRGPKPRRRVGVFRGTIRFEGERGFTRVGARRVRGEVRQLRRRVCRRGSESLVWQRPSGPDSAARRFRLSRSAARPAGPQVNVLVAVDRSPHRVAAFEALNIELPEPFADLGRALGTFAEATVLETREGMRIQRSVLGFGGEGALLIGPRRKPPTRATVALPRPFRGSADYRKTVGAPATWAGPLRVWMPGAGVVRFTDPEFSAGLCRLGGRELLAPQNSRCLRRLGAILPGRFASGGTIGA